MTPLPIILIAACGGPTPGPAPFLADLSTLSPPLRQCVETDCPSLDSADALSACLAGPCAERETTWAVDLSLVRYQRDAGILTVEVGVDHTPGGHGSVSVPPAGERWLGVTVLTESGEDIDLAVQTVLPDRLDEPFTISSEVGNDVRDIIFGLWGTQITPCDVERSGCRMFGFVLDDSLAAWPPMSYLEAPPRRQRILPEQLSLEVQSAGGALTPATDTIHQALEQESAAFGTQISAHTQRLASSAAKDTEIRFRDDHDSPLASLIAARLDGKPSLTHDPAASADLVVILGGSDQRHACLVQQCTDQVDAALLSCAARCP